VAVGVVVDQIKLAVMAVAVAADIQMRLLVEQAHQGKETVVALEEVLQAMVQAEVGAQARQVAQVHQQLVEMAAQEQLVV
jgi:hypothetical protein